MLWKYKHLGKSTRTIPFEEEANPPEIIQKLKFIGKDGRGLLMIDKDLAARVFTIPTATEL
jgi:ferritin